MAKSGTNGYFGVSFKFDDSELRELLRKAKDKKVYRELANKTLEDLKQDAEYASHVLTGELRDSWETTPLKMRDGGYSVFGELYSTSDHSYFEKLRGGSHDTVAQAMELLEMELGDSLENVLEGLLK